MSLKSYMLLCLAVTVVVSVSILLVPGVAETIEGRLLAFLSTNAG